MSVIVREHNGSLAGYHGVYAFRRDGGRCIVSAPAGYVPRLRDALAPERAFDVEALVGVLGDEVERVVGPARIAYADDGDCGARMRRVCVLEAADGAAMRRSRPRAARRRGSTAASSSTARQSSAHSSAANCWRQRRTRRGATTSCTQASSRIQRIAGAGWGERRRARHRRMGWRLAA